MKAIKRGQTPFKYKYYHDASVLISFQTINKRSVGISELSDGELIPINKVTISSNASLQKQGQIIDVKYRHYHTDGSLIEAQFLGRETMCFGAAQKHLSGALSTSEFTSRSRLATDADECPAFLI